MALEQRSKLNTKYNDIETLYKSNLVFKLFDTYIKYSVIWQSVDVYYFNIILCMIIILYR